jgi:thiamine biosynthesis protein ThiI
MTGTRSAAPELVLVRYGELAIKGKNRFEFENALARNIVQAASPISPVRVERHRGRLAVHAERRTERLARRLQDVFGIASVSAARRADKDVEAIAAVAREELAHALEAWPRDRRIRFRVTTRRADKTFPLTSTELDRAVADLVMPEHEARLLVDLSRPELELEVDLRPHAAYVFATRLPGPGGLPVGTLGKGVCLLSGGIDSPVAAWMCMKRGCAVVFVSFHSFPYIGEASRRKIEHLVERLARFQPRSRLYSVPFTDVQTAIRDTAPDAAHRGAHRAAREGRLPDHGREPGPGRKPDDGEPDLHRRGVGPPGPAPADRLRQAGDDRPRPPHRDLRHVHRPRA